MGKYCKGCAARTVQGNHAKSALNSEVKNRENRKKSCFSNEKVTKTAHIEKKNTDLLG